MKTIHGEEPLSDLNDLTYTEKCSMDVLLSRFAAGRKKYGVGISFDQHSNAVDWIDEAIEEAADQMQYLIALKLYLIDKEKK